MCQFIILHKSDVYNVTEIARETENVCVCVCIILTTYTLCFGKDSETFECIIFSGQVINNN